MNYWRLSAALYTDHVVIQNTVEIMLLLWCLFKPSNCYY